MGRKINLVRPRTTTLLHTSTYVFYTNVILGEGRLL